MKISNRKVIFFIFSFFIGSCYLFCDEPASIVGKWKFNQKESDNPQKKFEHAREDEDRNYGSQHEHSGGWHHGDHEGGGKGNHMFDPPASLDITFSDPEFKVTDDKGATRSYFTDGRKSQQQINENRTITYTSKWENDSLIVESQSPSGGNMTQTYYLSPDRKRLYVKLQTQSMMSNQPITIVRVYDSITEQPKGQ